MNSTRTSKSRDATSLHSVTKSRPVDPQLFPNRKLIYRSTITTMKKLKLASLTPKFAHFQLKVKPNQVTPNYQTQTISAH